MKILNKKEKTPEKSIHPISGMIHNKIKNIINANSEKIESILDIGGTGKLGVFGDFNIVNANITEGIDGTRLPYADNSFDATVSIATLEHVSDYNKFLEEAVRVSRMVSIHWFPMGLSALKAEKIKEEFGHVHPCILPEYEKIASYSNISIQPYMTCREHLLLLSTINKDFATAKWYDTVDNFSDNDYYGYFAIIKKK